MYLKMSLIKGWKNDGHHYDEIERHHVYNNIVKHANNNPKKVKNFKRISKKAFSGDNVLCHIPRILSIGDHHVIYVGVQQRARALHAFIEDHYFGHKTYRSFVHDSNMNNILNRSHEHKFIQKYEQGHTRQYGFLYGPDIIRGPDSHFYVCEDNIGYLGGIGDLCLANQLLLDHFPEYLPYLHKSNPMILYKQISQLCHQFVEPHEILLYLKYPRTMSADHEEDRASKIFSSMGFKIATIPLKKSDRKIFVMDDGVYYVDGSSKQKIGCMMLGCEPFDVDPQNALMIKQVITDEAHLKLSYYQSQIEKNVKKNIKKNTDKNHLNKQKYEHLYQKLFDLIQRIVHFPNNHNFTLLSRFLRRHHQQDFKNLLSKGIPKIFDAYFEGKVRLINSGGFDFLGDKGFYPYVEKCIAHYLNEQPILKSIPTQQIRPSNIDTVFDPNVQHNVVVKGCIGRGGDSVFVGCKIPRQEFLKCKNKVVRKMDNYIVQKYIPLSTCDKYLVDLRAISCVTSNHGQLRLAVGSTFWGRGVVKDSNGKVNLSDEGVEFAVFREHQGH